MNRQRARLLLVGVGGLGCAAALALARSGVAVLGLCDDDEVELGNLHRQILYGEADVRTSKVEAAARALSKLEQSPDLRIHPTRLLPDNALNLVRQYDVVIEGSDNFATKFLAADACALAGVSVVHASAVRWIGTALAVGPRGKPCYRCVFEDVPSGYVPNCADAGVMGPVVGVVAAVQVDLALAIADGLDVRGRFVTFDGKANLARHRDFNARADCPLCGIAPRIRDIQHHTYVPTHEDRGEA